jgi:hypothetical protein
MDMSEPIPEDHEPMDLTLHRRLADACVKLCCVAIIGRAASPDDHRVDMMLLADMICEAMILHAHHPADTEAMFNAVNIHAVNVRCLLRSAIAENRTERHDH